MTAMRILHVSSSLDRRDGGPPVVLAGLAIAQARAGAVVTVAANFNTHTVSSLADTLREGGVSVSLIGPATGKQQRHPQIRPTLIKLIADADVVHIHTLWEDIQHQAAVISRRLKKPYVIVPHGMLDPWALSRHWWFKQIYLVVRLRRDLNGAMFIHALNVDEAKLIEPLRLRTECRIIPNGFSPEQLAPPVSSAVRNQAGPTILFLSRLHYKKGLDYLADAFIQVAARHATVRLVVAGPDDGAEKEFDARIAAVGLHSRVDRVGALYGQAKIDALKSAAVFVLPSRQEGFSVAILESLACGTPVVISDACHFPEVAAESAGAIVPLEPSAIADAVLQIVNDPDRRRAMSAAARSLAQRYTWDHVARRTLDLYGRPKVAILATAMTPYRIALHQRIVNELPGVELASLFTQSQSNAPWQLDLPVEIHPVSFVEHRPLVLGREVIRWLKRHRPAAVIVNGYNEWARLQVLAWCRRNGTPVLLWGDSNLRGDRATGVKAIVKSRLVRWAVRHSDAVLPCGSLGQAYFEKYGADPRKMFWMPYEPDYAMIQTLPAASIDEARRRFDLPATRRRIVYSGRLVAIKRVDLLLRAFIELAPERPDWDLVIVGDGPERSSLAALVPPALASRIRWCGFVGEQATVSAIYRCCDVLAHPAEIEPWGLVINEAAAAGLAIVTTDAVGAAAELVRDGVNGRIVPAGDPATLLDALRDVTVPQTLDRYRLASLEVLLDWRKRADPVESLRRALRQVSAISFAES
jgi:glycosyltransferase involved in cell wall biosynthesis